MKTTVSRRFVKDLKTSIAKGDSVRVTERLRKLHPADIAEAFSRIDTEEAKFIYKLLDEKTAAEVLVEMDEDVKEKLLQHLSTREIAEQVVDHMASDDAADLIGELPEHLQTEVISQIEDPEQAKNIADLLTYEEHTAGALMTKELIKVQPDWNVLKCVREMRRQAGNLGAVYAIYVVETDDNFLGLLSLKKLLIAPAETLINDLYKKEIITVKTSAMASEVAQMMQKYNFAVMPVVDDNGKLAGRITIDDVVDYIQQEAQKDYQMASGLTEVVEPHDKVWILSRARMPWLLVALAGGIGASMIIGQYEGQIQIYPEMAFFMPLIMAMGGNVGVQASAIIVQGLANNTIVADMIAPKLIKELAVGLLNGLICSVLIFIYNLIINEPVNLGITVSVSLLTAILFASFFGTFVPLTLHRLKLDPALATGPFITTLNDILGIAIYFIIGRFLYMQ
ncbi:MAG: magnesium transporter [Bacteroidetes bacterium]|nr:magnesium transporter [Bacteroidota bacterium]